MQLYVWMALVMTLNLQGDLESSLLFHKDSGDHNYKEKWYYLTF